MDCIQKFSWIYLKGKDHLGNWTYTGECYNRSCKQHGVKMWSAFDSKIQYVKVTVIPAILKILYKSIILHVC